MRIALIGDVALFGKNCVKNKDDFIKRTEYVRQILQSFDYVVANLETPLTGETSVIGGKSAYIKGCSEDVELLKHLGITHVSLANNHVYDYGKKGLCDTIAHLENAGIEWFGIDDKPAYICEEAICISLRGYCCYTTNGCGLEQKKYTVNSFNPVWMEKKLDEDLSKGMIPILSCHWGEEHVHYPNRMHVVTARGLAENRKIVIHGHHPHVIQGVEQWQDSIIAYSLGNFCFDDVYTSKSKAPLIKLSVDNMQSFVLGLTIHSDGQIEREIIPFSFEKGVFEACPDVLERISEWTNALRNNDYIQLRKDALSTYISNRKKKRDIQWYIKRLNLESVRIILRGRHNAKKLHALMDPYLQKEE